MTLKCLQEWQEINRQRKVKSCTVKVPFTFYNIKRTTKACPGHIMHYNSIQRYKLQKSNEYANATLHVVRLSYCDRSPVCVEMRVRTAHARAAPRVCVMRTRTRRNAYFMTPTHILCGATKKLYAH